MPFPIANLHRWCITGALVSTLATLAAQDATDTTVPRANALAAQGDRAGAVSLLEARLKAAPDDSLARQTLLGLRIAETEAEVRALLSEQAKTHPGRLGDPDYEEARKRASDAVRRRLDVAEYYVRQHRYADAVGAINAILRDHPHDPAAMTLKLQVLNALADEERVALVKEKAAARENAINDAIDAAIMPGELPRTKRQIIIFDEDVDAAERAALKKRLQSRIDLIFDGLTKYKNPDGSEDVAKPASVRQLLQNLFAYAGINYVLLDSAIGEETLTLHLVQETVENCLNTISKLVKVRYNYSGGTVFVASTDTEILVTEIIRLKSGLTDVNADPELGNFGGGSSGGSSGSSGGGSSRGGSSGSSSSSRTGNNSTTAGGAGAAAARGGSSTTGGAGGKAAGGGGAGGGNGQGGESDLERLLEKAPELIVGWPKDGKLLVDRKSNTVYVCSTPAAIADLKRLIDSLDYNNVQVLIEARFVEVQDTASLALGVNWETASVNGVANLTGNTTGFGPINVVPSPVAANAATIGANGLIAQLLATDGSGFGIKAQINALEQKGLADTLSEPKILTLNNSKGLIEVKKDISYISSYENIGYSTSYNNNDSNNNNNPYYPNNGYSNATPIPVYEKDYAGIRLEIRPSVARNSDIITLIIVPTVREMLSPPTPTPFTIASGDGSGGQVTNTIDKPPEFDTRSLATTLHVKNGGTVVLGGLAREKENRNRSGVPVMSRIPFLGGLFRNTSESSTRSNLMIFVTAHIIDPTGAKQGDEIEKLRDTARIIMPAEVAEAERNSRTKEAEEERKGSEKARTADRTEIWRRDRRN